MSYPSEELGKNDTKNRMAQYGVGHRMMPWAIGDLWNSSVEKFGEEWCLQYLQPLSGLKESHLLDYSYVARRYPNENYRHYDLSIWHHRDCLSLPPNIRNEFLVLAVTHQLTTVDLRRMKKMWKFADGAKDPGSLVQALGKSAENVTGGVDGPSKTDDV